MYDNNNNTTTTTTIAAPPADVSNATFCDSWSNVLRNETFLRRKDIRDTVEDEFPLS